MMKYFILTIITIATLSWASYHYPNDPNISNELGEPFSDSTYYFPVELFIDSIEWSNIIEVNLDTSSVKRFSQELWFSKEPILFNYYLDKQIYRLTWLRSFDPAIVLRLENQSGRITLVEKKMTLVNAWKPVPENRLHEVDSIILKHGIGSAMEYRPDSAILESYIKKMPRTVWLEFENLLQDQKFKNMPSTVASSVLGFDGSEWILEEHKENSYHVVNRWSPGDRRYTNFRIIGDFLIDLSSYDKEERY
jgi:hypothetical protein